MPFVFSYCFSELSPVCAIVGGVMAQEVIKVLRLWCEVAELTVVLAFCSSLRLFLQGTYLFLIVFCMMELWVVG